MNILQKYPNLAKNNYLEYIIKSPAKAKVQLEEHQNFKMKVFYCINLNRYYK